MKSSALGLLGLLSTVLAIEHKNVRNSKQIFSKGRPKRLRRTQQTTQISDEELVGRRAKFGGGNLIAKWVKEAKEDLEEIQELLNKALDDDSSMPPLPVPVPNPTMPPTLPCGMPDVERRGQISATIATVSKVEDLNKADSPQNMALDWLLNKDDMYVCPEDGNLVQRYVAAVFYYSSIGDGWLQCSAPGDLDNPDSIEKANANCNIEVDSPDVGGTDAWLTPVSECQWGGLACRRNVGKSLVRIDFESNNLQGTIPFELQELKELRFLHLEEGKTAGTLPQEIGNISQLEELDVNFNLLVGSIPDSIYQLKNLVELDMNDNLLQGSLSSDIGRLTSLRFLQLSKNRMTGTIPSEIGILSRLAIANFDRNQFNGSMPQEVCNLRNTQDGLIGSLTCDCLIPSAKFYVECAAPGCCTACFEPSLLVTGDEAVLPDRNP
mmetsp:Transcript_4088/g.11614  ORF Transcript_4088/g.11614 Transcript_4088/m.11614 type:complete len:437 (+) Transcript_4088:224-1534(+)|eukprot:CAMPEP_0181045434 /NCGR_PEP_ID=MMETSP1070-20121207/13805_1 /TAXON_ID=265543 /ORGANISM="Minutocellus polymorphus, Strain NH13" /LENGTH=436 /DNA_ID=CAMNT_0023123961 /DNA_START=211 /DNA_END=1521 /DNA_ORIENTATION=+